MCAYLDMYLPYEEEKIKGCKIYFGPHRDNKLAKIYIQLL